MHAAEQNEKRSGPSVSMSEPLVTDETDRKLSKPPKPAEEKAAYVTQEIERWPPAPTSLEKPTLDKLLGILIDVASIGLFFLFIALAAVAARVHGRLVDWQQWRMLFAALNATVTIFPLVYTFIAARTIRFLAAWKFERGTTLGSLEQMLASRSLGGAITILWSLRIVNLTGLLLVIVAAVSPLGGQAALQMLKTQDKAELSQPEISYLSSLAGSTSILELSPGYLTENLPALNSLYTSSISASPRVKNSSVDLWGNVKIPWLPRDNAAVLDREGWYNIPVEPVLDKYSSLVGVPILNLPSGKNTTFSIETSYLNLDCYDFILDAPVNATHPLGSSQGNQSAAEGYQGSIPTTRAGFRIALDSTRPGYTDSAIWSYLNDTATSYPQRTLLFQSPAGGEGFGRNNIVHCRIWTTYVEAYTVCLSPPSSNLSTPTCSVTRLRSSLKPHPHENLTPLEFGQYLASFGENFPEATKFASTWVTSSSASSLAEMYLVNPQNPLDPTPDDPLTFRQALRLHELVSPAQVSVRLGQLVNSYHLGSLAPRVVTGLQASALSQPVNITVREGVVVSMNQTRYVCRWGWWSFFVVACVVLLAVAVAGIVVRAGLTGPDILGYVSSLTRDSPYVKVAEGGSALDGADRARLLRGLRVQLRDAMDGTGEVGRLVFGSIEETEEGVKRPVVGRKYL